jgi:hypothetical protein
MTDTEPQPPEPEPELEPSAEEGDEPGAGGQATTTAIKDYLGRPLITPTVNSKDYLGRATTVDKDHLGRFLLN